MSKTSRTRTNQRESSFSEKSQAYLQLHAHAFFSSLGRFFRNPFSSAMTIIVMAITISLATGFYLVVLNLQQLTGNIESTNQISLFLKSSINEASGEQLTKRIKANHQVERVKLISKQQGLEDFKQYSGFGEVLNILDNNPLPAVIQVLPKNTLNDLQGVNQLMEKLNRLPEVDYAQMDMQWITRLQAIMKIMQRGVLLLATLLGFAVLFITGNSIRLELQNRRDEVLIAKLVGATHSFIQRPFLYTGFWLGLFSGILAWILVTLILFLMQTPIEALSGEYDGQFVLRYLNLFETFVLLVLTSALGVIGAWVVLLQQLKQIKPE